jgi:hypothetical protein
MDVPPDNVRGWFATAPDATTQEIGTDGLVPLDAPAAAAPTAGVQP